MRFCTSFFIGVALGVFLGLILAPQPGDQMRRLLMEQARQQRARFRRSQETEGEEYPGP